MAADVAGFALDPRGVLQCEVLTQWQWLDHGFSTRQSAGWLEDAELASLKQIHSGRILSATGAGVQGEADALITRQAGLYVGVRTADCLPILLVDPVRRAVAAIHSGWRGTAAGIGAKTIARMSSDFGSRPGDLYAAVGPGIGVCCYEVGPEVAEQFGRQGRVHLDLAAEIARQLQIAGIPAGQISRGTFCTFCQGDLFWSYRREGEAAGRMWSGAAVL